MTVFGGDAQGTGVATNATWVLSNANGLGGAPVWSNIVSEGASGSPLARAFHTAIYDAATNRMTIFGGSTGTDVNDTWVLANANGIGGPATWTQLTPAGVTPVARDCQTAVYDGTTNRMIIFGGEAGVNFFNDVWLLTNANGIVGSQLQITQLLPNLGGNAGAANRSRRQA
jgi:hypothetical protein